MFSKYVIFLLSSLGTSLCLLGVAIFLAQRKHWQGSIGLVKLAFGWLWVWFMPAPSDFESDQQPPGLLAWLPDAIALDGSGRAFKESVGRWTGW